VTQLADQCIALAAIAQAAMLVDVAAYGRPFDAARVGPLIDGIFATDPKDAASVFGDLTRLDLGFESAAAMIGRSEAALFSPTRYVFAVLDVERRLRRRPDVVAALGDGIRALAAERSGMPDDELLRRLSALYQSTISTLDRRIQVTGLPDVLTRDHVAAQIRSLLLGAIRAAWLWRQLGGRRWQLLLRRTTIRDELRAHVKGNARR
jgi:high frequency lysogenization protein